MDLAHISKEIARVEGRLARARRALRDIDREIRRVRPEGGSTVIDSFDRRASVADEILALRTLLRKLSSRQRILADSARRSPARQFVAAP